MHVWKYTVSLIFEKNLVFFFNEAHDTVPGSIKYLLEVGYFGMLEEINSASII